jgi:DNA-binding transcriptional LysR family regulator
MNWSAIAFDWNHVRAFLATAEEGSFSAAARALGLTQPTLGRQVAALEQALGVTLFERAGHTLILTRPGLDLLEHVRSMGEAAQRVSLMASGASQAIEGQVRITASDVVCVHVLPPAIAELRRAAPLIEIDLVAANDIRDLTRREADIAIRHVRPDQPDLIAKRLPDATARLYAAQGYLDTRGRPATPEDLAAHDFISFGDAATMIAALAPLGIPVTRANFRLGSESGLVAWEMVRRGLGIAPMSDAVAAATPGVEPVLPDMPSLTFPVWLTTHRELHTSRRIRLVYDLLADFLSPGSL